MGNLHFSEHPRENFMLANLGPIGDKSGPMSVASLAQGILAQAI